MAARLSVLLHDDGLVRTAGQDARLKVQEHHLLPAAAAVLRSAIEAAT